MYTRVHNGMMYTQDYKVHFNVGIVKHSLSVLDLLIPL